jgi:hypothetical protein
VRYRGTNQNLPGQIPAWTPACKYVANLVERNREIELTSYHRRTDAPFRFALMATALGLPLRERVAADLRAAVMSLAAGPSLPVVFTDAPFAEITRNWLAHLDALGIRRRLVLALDDAAETSFPGETVVRLRATGGWGARLLALEWLARAGIDFICSDADAVWLRDPMPWFDDARFDLVFSPATNRPTPMWRRWGFTVSSGLFGVRANEKTAAFLSAVRATGEVGDDALNAALLTRGVAWDDLEPGYQLGRANPMVCYREVLPGASDDLAVALLPHHLFPRLPIAAPTARVRHPLGPDAPAARVATLRAFGCWRL